MSAQYLKKELLLCKDVAKIDFWGIQQEAIYIEFERSRLAEFKVVDSTIATTYSFLPPKHPGLEVGMKRMLASGKPILLSTGMS